jgi:hypothetical protein
MTHLPLHQQFQISLQDARAIAANPTPDQSPFLRKLAWFSLKAARDQVVIQSRLPRPTHPDRPGAVR